MIYIFGGATRPGAGVGFLPAAIRGYNSEATVLYLAVYEELARRRWPEVRVSRQRSLRP